MVTDIGDGKSFLESFDEITLDLIHSDFYMAKEFLQKEGIDVDEELEYSTQQVKKLKFLARAKMNSSKNEIILKTALEKLRVSIAENAEKAGRILRDLLRDKTPAVQYRKLEEWTDDEIREVLNDVDLVRLLEELEDD